MMALMSFDCCHGLMCYECSNCDVTGGNIVQCQSGYDYCADMTIVMADQSQLLFSRFCSPNCPGSSGSYCLSCCSTGNLWSFFLIFNFSFF